MGNSNFMLKIFDEDNRLDPIMVLHFETKAELQIAREIITSGLRVKHHMEIYKWFGQHGEWTQINPAYSF